MAVKGELSGKNMQFIGHAILHFRTNSFIKQHGEQFEEVQMQMFASTINFKEQTCGI